MFSHKHYVPILKGKPAEFQAVTKLKSVNSMTPLFEAIPSKSPATIPEQLKKNKWDNTSKYFVDFLFFDAKGPASNPPLSAILAGMKAAALLQHAAIPVTGTGRSPAYQKAVSQSADPKRGLAIRLIPDDFDNQADLTKSLNALSGLLKHGPSTTDIIIDVGSIAGHQASIIAQVYRAYLGLLPNIDAWRSVTIVGGAFPGGLDASMTRNAWNNRPRIDWQAWLAVVTGSQKVKRLPSYGDYSISHPGLPPEGQATILAQLRYSTDSQFMIWKGHNVRKHQNRFGQFNGICKELINRPEYRGPSFSLGDSEIQAKATTAGSPGSAQTWRKIGANHHIETALDQIANPPRLQGQANFLADRLHVQVL